MTDKQETDAKRIKRERSAKIKARQQAESRCFWTWPWGHVYKWQSMGRGMKEQGQCVICGAVRYRR